MNPEDVLCTDLVTLDMLPLDKECVMRAFHGSARDMTIVHRSVAGVLYAICEFDINRIVVDADIKNGRWRTDTWDASCGYAADVIDDWLRHGTDTAKSLMDIILVYVDDLKTRAESTPEWHFSLEATVIREGRRIPRVLDRDTTVVLPLY